MDTSNAHHVQAIAADLEEFVGEVAPTTGVLAVLMEIDGGPRAQVGPMMEEVCSGELHWPVVRQEILGWLTGEQDAMTFDWEGDQLGVYRVGSSAALWVLCESPRSERKVRATWKRRRRPWADRVDREAAPVAEEIEDSASQGWRAELEPRLASLLEGTRELFATLRGAEPESDIEGARAEFESLATEWSSFCDPSVVSFPMLLDSLRQCLSSEGTARADFFAKMQELMAASMR